jgi:hypothetical protein
LTGINILEKIMPEEVQSAPFDQVLTGETHHLTNMFTMPRLVAVNTAMFAGRLIVKRTEPPAFKGIKQKFATGSADRILFKREIPQTGIIAGDRSPASIVMRAAVNCCELQQHFKIFEFFTTRDRTGAVLVGRGFRIHDGMLTAGQKTNIDAGQLG